MTPPGLQKLNAATTDQAVEWLLQACGCRAWAASVAAARPFVDMPALFAAAEQAAEGLTREQWLEAFSHHPRIGQTDLSSPQHARTRELSSREQSGMAAADDQQRRALVEANAAYEKKFGHVFLICATGKSAGQMLGALAGRIGNTPQAELAIAAGEQRKITRLRLERLVNQ